MPIFEFYCRQCKKKTEDIFLVGDHIPQSIVCECGREAFKTISSPSFKIIDIGHIPTRKNIFEGTALENEGGLEWAISSKNS